MKNVASPRTLAAVAFATVACLMLFAVVLVQPLEASPQQATSEEEIAAKVKAELEARLAETTRRLHERFAEFETLGQADQQELQRALEELQANEAQIRQVLEQRLQASKLRRVEELAHRAQQMQARAMANAEYAAQRATVGRYYAVGRGSCDVYGESILDHAEELELTDDQSDQIRSVQRETRRTGIERRADIEVAEMDLEALYESDEPDLAAIRAQLESLAMLDIDNQMAGLSLYQQVRQILTPAQIDTLEEMRQDETRNFVVISGGSGGRRIRIGGFDCWR